MSTTILENDLDNITLNSDTGASTDDSVQPVSVTCLFNDASLYNQFLAEHDDPAKTGETSVHQTMNNLTQLVGDDLDPTEKDIANRFAQISVGGQDWDANDGDHENADPTDADSSSVLSSESSTSSHASTPGNGFKAILEATEPTVFSDSAEAVAIPPEQLVTMLVEEFGPLCPEGEETLLAEVDGAIVQDVAILVRGIFAPLSLMLISSLLHFIGRVSFT
jgi:sterol 3beta-glucosyltransferase